jgi:hypothetical protein
MCLAEQALPKFTYHEGGNNKQLLIASVIQCSITAQPLVFY